MPKDSISGLPITRSRFLTLTGALALAATLPACSREVAPYSQFLLIDGSQTSTWALRGQVALVNFWATSCSPCVAEMPQLAATYQKFRDRGYETLAVAMRYDKPEYITRFAQQRALPFMVAYDHDGQAARAWGNVRVTPTTFLLNKRGEIVKRFVGQPNFGALEALIEKLLAET